MADLDWSDRWRRRLRPRRAWRLHGAGLVLAVIVGRRAPRRRPRIAAAAPVNDSARFSPLADITRENVRGLTAAWTYHTGDFSGGRGPAPTGQVPGVQTRPVFADGRVYVTTPSSIVIAIDGDTGREDWRYDPQAGAAARGAMSRIVALRCGRDRVHQPSAPSSPAPVTGAWWRSMPCTAGRARPSARRGVLDLRPGVDARTGEAYAITSPPAIWRDLVIVGGLVPEGTPRGPAGDVRAFDVRTGQERWRFHTVPRPGEPGHDTWSAEAWQRRTGANVWSSMSVDEDRGLVFLPIGSPSYDFFGGDRPGQNLFGNSLVALDAATGRRRWHAQLVHHDLWDFDPPAQPILADIPHAGGARPVVIQVTKMGLVFVFDRTTGEPVFGIEERAVPPSDVPGEHAWPTQPFPVKPPPLSRHTPLTRDDLTTVTAESRRECDALFASVRSGGLYTPPGRELTLSFPGTMGGATWSGGAVHPGSAYLIVNTNEIGAMGQMVPQPGGAPCHSGGRRPPGPMDGSGTASTCRARSRPGGCCTPSICPRAPSPGRCRSATSRRLPLGGITGTGAPNLGGAIVTAGGLVFIGGASDSRFRAFDVRTGRELWRADLPASGHATPLSYRGRSGRQFVVIAAGGGGRFSDTISDAIVAFALPLAR